MTGKNSKATQNVAPARVKVKSNIKAIGDLVGNYSESAIHSVAAPSQSGKTTLALTLLYEFSDLTGLNTCLYDTEGGANEFVDMWHETLSKRYPNAKKPLVRMRREWEGIMEDHGHKPIVKVSDGGKIMVNYLAAPFTFADYCREHNVGMVVYDSLTMPMKPLSTSNENFPTRNAAQAKWFNAMFNLIDFQKIIVWVNHHVTKNPADPYAVESMSGGSAVEYHSKIIIHMKKVEAKGARTYRRLTLKRHFYIKDFDPQNPPRTLIKLTDDGYQDATEEQLEEDKRKAKAD